MAFGGAKMTKVEGKMIGAGGEPCDDNRAQRGRGSCGSDWRACRWVRRHCALARKDEVVFGPTGHAVSNATVTVCVATAMGSPCAPLETICTDATLTTASANPFQTDGIGNYHFYAPAGRHLLQKSGPQITGTITYSDVILSADASSSGSGNKISAFGLTLGGNLSAAGNATITGTLKTTDFNPRTFTPTTLSVGGNETVLGSRPRIVVTAYGAKGEGSSLR
jgi:hypothetical protein